LRRGGAEVALATAQEHENVRVLFSEVEKNDAQKLVLVKR
jgi:hypothetical protein